MHPWVPLYSPSRDAALYKWNFDLQRLSGVYSVKTSKYTLRLGEHPG